MLASRPQKELQQMSETDERLKAIKRRLDVIQDGYEDTDLLPVLAGIAVRDVPWLLNALDTLQRENQALKAPLTDDEAKAAFLECGHQPNADWVARDKRVFNAVMARRAEGTPNVGCHRDHD